MRRKLTTLRSKSAGTGPHNGNGNGNPRALVDEATYREHSNFISQQGGGGITVYHYDTEYSGWSNQGRSRDQAISLRSAFPSVG
jgi:hypothetical protein